MIDMLVCSKYSQTFDYVLLGNLPLRGSFFIMFDRLVCSFVTNLLFVCFNGLQRVWSRVWGTALVRVFCVVCVFTYHFGMLVVGCV